MALTALENDLLAYVERLVTACETLTEELNGLEARSTDGMQNQMDGLAACVSALIQSQTASMAALQDLLSAGSNYSAVNGQLQTSLRLVKAAEKQLNDH
ncbi:hypothetical protein SULPSESMR1_02131 [Pseudosulfitobacter pseudonitzschiae]|uniref:Uncharacterized protein n=1 Tax=Pseudosulfitobacter pseudonitzschiae TaxID=1402135 RepID=A0A221K1N6_9RHOB|nr:hypothetical protein SULPSESMR1_02131 [Pseudosulfitobacter pseudonitzschiae]